MKMKLLIIGLFSLLIASVSFAVDSTKPSTHNSTWEKQHGQAAKTNMAECLTCHEERSECIACHEDTAPRSHTVTFVNKTHGLESRWNRTNCQTCHKQDFCDSCHETAYPMSHARANFASGVATDPGSHCGTSCVIPTGSWQNTPAKNCIVCHKTRPVTKAGALHTMR